MRTIGCVLKPEEVNEVIGTKQIIWTFFILLEKRSLETVVFQIIEVSELVDKHGGLFQSSQFYQRYELQFIFHNNWKNHTWWMYIYIYIMHLLCD